MTQLLEIMPELFTRSELLIWNFSELTEQDSHKNIQEYMTTLAASGQDPHEAFHGRGFNELVFSQTDARYLIGRYGENRQDILAGSHIAAEGRVYHLAIDIFTRDQEPVFAPCDGQIVISDYEPGLHNYGNYIVLKPDDPTLPFIFFGHLATPTRTERRVRAGEQIGQLGSFENLENGGWSIHLHLQLMREMPTHGEAPIGYSDKANLTLNQQLFPDPMSIFTKWRVSR